MKNNNELSLRSGRLYFDPFFDAFFDFPTSKQNKRGLSFMKTDISEDENSYKLSIELPGFKKENIALDLNNGYLTVTATREEETEEKKYIRRERSCESCKRSFYVGEGVTEDDVSATMENGVLLINLLKRVEEAPKTKRIEIK